MKKRSSLFDPRSVDESIIPLDEGAMLESKRRWDSIAKPLGSLGMLEDYVVRIAGLTGSADVDLSKRAVVVMCADNGVVREGVSQSGQDVTAVVAANMATGETSVCRMAARIGADVFPYNMGMSNPAPGTIDCSIAPETGNLSCGPAMTPEQTSEAIERGIWVVGDLASKGYRIIATGEMGIGNTTTSSAITSVLLGISPEEVTGRGSGLTDAGLKRKIDAIHRGIEVNSPDPDDAFDVLCKLGGFDIAALVGVFVGGAIHRVPILIDGFISSTAALVASRMCPSSSIAMLASHLSAETAMKAVLDDLGLFPPIHAGMRLGEGTGAVCALSILDLGMSVYEEMVSFDDTGLEAYVPLGGESELEGSDDGTGAAGASEACDGGEPG